MPRVQPRIAVCGTPQLAAEVFEAIRASEVATITAAITMPDRPAGRGKKLQPPAVKAWATEHDVPVWQPEKADGELARKLHDAEVELVIVMAYGRIFSGQFLQAAPPLWNLHLSLLPKYRGSTPVQAAILAGEDHSGVTVFRITPGMDDGPILGQSGFSITGVRADRVNALCTEYGSDLLVSLLAKTASGEPLPERPQAHEQATFCQKISKQDGQLDPQMETAESALRKIRAFYPWPSAWFTSQGKRIKLLDAQPTHWEAKPGKLASEENHLILGFAAGTLEITELQPEGKRAMTGKAFAAGLR